MTVPDLDVWGLDVHQTVTEPARPAVSHGRLAIRNSSAAPRRVTIDQVMVIGEASSIAVERFYVYRLPSYDEEAADAIEIAQHEEASFEVSFAAQPLAPGLATDVAVTFDVTADGVTERIVSLWSWTIRTPRR
jgi:hypothetical protein